MKEIDDKVDYEPALPELLSLLKAIAFLFIAGSTLLVGAYSGAMGAVLICYLIRDLVPILNFSRNPAAINFVGMIALCTSVGGIIAACWLLPRIHRWFYRW